MFDFIGDVVGAVLEAAWGSWPTAKQRVERGIGLSRRRNLSAKRRQFAETWLEYGLQNLADLGLQGREQEIRTALSRLKEAAAPDPSRNS
jgi:hypothetical protein